MLRFERGVQTGLTIEWYRTLQDELGTVERWLWLSVIVTLVLDVWFTQTGLQHGLREGNPAMRVLIDSFGVEMLALAKLLVLSLAGFVRLNFPFEHGMVIPLGLALPWAGAVLINGVLMVRL